MSCLPIRCAMGLAVIAALAWTLPASAQYPYPYPPVYAPKIYSPYAGTGGYLSGQAQLLNAAGNFQKQQQDAQILNQKALQEQIKTEKLKFEWEKYKAANTPTFGQQQAAVKMQKEYRMLTNPTDGEIVSGDALNILMAYLQSQHNSGMKGPAIGLDAKQVSRINVFVPLAAGSAGLLKNGGQVIFPIVLKGETERELSGLLQQAVAGCVNGTLDFKLYQQVRDTLEELRKEHKAKFHKDQIDGSSFIIGKHFLDDLDDAVHLLEQPGSAQLLNGAYTAKGATVAELVLNMHQQGLRFAAATQGDEPAYVSLHSSFVTYANGLQSSPVGILNVP